MIKCPIVLFTFLLDPIVQENDEQDKISRKKLEIIAKTNSPARHYEKVP